ncbi:Carnitine O-acetyltransferase mitochondrial [Asimina triloba]
MAFIIISFALHNCHAFELSWFILSGVGSTIGAGVYVLVGTVAREHSGPSLAISFLIAGIAAALSAFCYAELASRCPSAGSAYHYSYICVGEGEHVHQVPRCSKPRTFPVNFCLIMARPMALFFGGQGSLPAFLARAYIPFLDISVDPCAAFLVLIVTGLLCAGIKEVSFASENTDVTDMRSISMETFVEDLTEIYALTSSFAQAIVTSANVCVMVFVIIAGGYLGFQTGWPGYNLPTGYFPFGVNGMLAGSATVFFAYIGFDTVASTAEEVKNPQRDLPLGIVSIVIVGLVPYYAMDPDTPISSAIASHGMHWAAYIITIGAVTALCSTLMGSMLPQPRILMAMARDGLLPPFFSDVNERTQVPVKSTIITGILAAVLALFMNVSQLAGMVSVGTLLAFTIVAVSILILRYVPPDEVPLPSSLQETVDSVSSQYSAQAGDDQGSKDLVSNRMDDCPRLHDTEASAGYPLIIKESNQETKKEQERRRIAAWSIAFVCVGAIFLTSAASAEYLPNFLRYSVCILGGLLLLCGLIMLSCIEEDAGRHSFGHTGGFLCPFIPLLPISCILINVYLLLNLGTGTWIRVSIWLLIGIFVYLFYGRTHSSLTNMVYVPAAHADEIYKSSSSGSDLA